MLWTRSKWQIIIWKYFKIKNRIRIYFYNQNRLKIKKIDVYNLNDIAIKNGFEMHHAKNDVLALKSWFFETKHDSFPAFSTYNVGCGEVMVKN